jgi:hypothetical protein
MASSVAVLSEQFAHLCLVLSCDKQGTSAERERGTRLRVLVAKQLDAKAGRLGLRCDQLSLQDRNTELDTNDVAHHANVPLTGHPLQRLRGTQSAERRWISPASVRPKPQASK